MQVKISITTEDGEVLEELIAESENPAVTTEVELARGIRQRLETSLSIFVYEPD